MNQEEIKNEEAKPITLVINKSQSMMLSMAITVLPKEMSIEDVMKFNGADGGGSGVGMLFGMGLMMLNKVVDADEREKLSNALQEGHDYVNAQVDVKAAANAEFVSKADYAELLDLTMKTHEKMYLYGIGARGESMTDDDVLPEDQEAFDILVKAHKLTK